MIPKKADVTNDPKLSTLLNTGANPFAGMPGFGNVYYPGDTKNSGGATLFHALALASTYGGLAYLTRSIAYKSKIKKKSDVDRKRIASYVNADMPIISPDPIKNTGQEMKEEMLGTEKLAMDKSAGLSQNLVASLIPVVALVGGFTGGSALADKYYREKEKKFAEKEDIRLKDKLDRLNYEKLQAVRGPAIPKMAEEDKMQEATRRVDARESGRTPTGFLAALIGLTAIGTGLGSAYFAKGYFDDRDPNRERLKALEKSLAHKAMVEAEQAPVIIPQMPESSEASLGSSIGAPSVSSGYAPVDSPARKKALPKLPPPSVDVTDPAMRQLIRG